MARFELKMFMVEEQDEAFEAYEYKVMCHVRDIENFNEVNKKLIKLLGIT